jgi:hypothetical protein
MLCNILADAFRGSLDTFKQTSRCYAYFKIGNDRSFSHYFHVIIQKSSYFSTLNNQGSRKNVVK